MVPGHIRHITRTVIHITRIVVGIGTTAVEEYVRGLSLGERAVLLYEILQHLAEVFVAEMKGMLAEYADRKAILDYEKSWGARFNYPLSSICSHARHELVRIVWSMVCQ